MFEPTDQPICPHCQEENDFEHTENFELYDKDENSHKVKCIRCTEEFWVKSEITFKFYTRKSEDELDDL